MTTTQEQLAFIKSRCIAANESILDLKFGCEVRRSSPKNRTKGWVITRGFLGIVYWIGNRTAVLTIPSAFEIIGSPIRLADILYAIGKSNNRGFAIDRTGGFLSYKYEDSWQVTEYKEVYNLLNDTIDTQSPELIAFVANILAINEE